MDDLKEKKASDWKFSTVLEFDSQVDSNFRTYGVRLFYFQSQKAKLTAYVLFGGTGKGVGLKFNVSNDMLKIGLEGIERLAKPVLGSEIKLSLPRKAVSQTSLEQLTIPRDFSLKELNGASGQLSSAGVGLGVGIGLLSVSANGVGKDLGKVLFNCQKLGLEFGRLGANATKLTTGIWYVPHCWETL